MSQNVLPANIPIATDGRRRFKFKIKFFNDDANIERFAECDAITFEREFVVFYNNNIITKAIPNKLIEDISFVSEIKN